MARGISRDELKALAECKLLDANLLFAHKRFSNAFYLGGYSVELGLKACVARQFGPEAIPDKQFVNDIHTHKLINLVGLAGLTSELKAEQQKSIKFQTNWGIVANWGPESRYTAVDSLSSHYLIEAIGDQVDGVMRWIRMHW